MFGFRYTLGIELSDKSNENGNDAFRIAKTLLMSSLPSFHHALQAKLADTFTTGLAKSETRKGVYIPSYYHDLLTYRRLDRNFSLSLHEVDRE